MKTKKIIFTIIMIGLAGVAGMLFYWKNSQPAPEEVVETQLDAIFKQNSTKNENELEKSAADFMKKIQETQLACALSEPAEHQEKFFEDVMEGLEKIDYEVSEISRSDEKAEVSVRMNSFKLREITKNSQNEFQSQLKENDSLSSEEMIEKLYELIAKEFAKGPSGQSKTEVIVMLNKKNHKWELENQFEDKILSAVLQQ